MDVQAVSVSMRVESTLLPVPFVLIVGSIVFVESERIRTISFLAH